MHQQESVGYTLNGLDRARSLADMLSTSILLLDHTVKMLIDFSRQRQSSHNPRSYDSLDSDATTLDSEMEMRDIADFSISHSVAR